KIHMPDAVLNGLLAPPQSPAECIFAQVTDCYSADLETRIEPCQFGGAPVCAECGCIASAGMATVGNYRLAGLVQVKTVFAASRKIGSLRVQAPRNAAA